MYLVPFLPSFRFLGVADCRECRRVFCRHVVVVAFDRLLVLGDKDSKRQFKVKRYIYKN